MDLSNKTAEVYMSYNIEDIIAIILEQNKLIVEQQMIIESKNEEIEEHLILIEDQNSIIDKQHGIIEENKIKIALQDKQILFIKNLCQTVNKVFTKPDVPIIEKELEVEPKVEIKVEVLDIKTKRKSNKTQYKLPSDIVFCDICDSKMRRDCYNRHQKSKTHLKNITENNNNI